MSSFSNYELRIGITSISTLKMHQTIEKAVQFLTSTITTPPTQEAVVEALLQAEKTARGERSQTTKQEKISHGFQQLLGTWRLGFITGTKATRKRAGVVLGAGRFLPSWIKILLSYAAQELADGKGGVENSVQLGLLKIVLTGPVKFYPKTNILAFDFTHMDMYLSGLKVYSGYIRNGKSREESFYQQSIKDQAFFTYFLIENNCIAARGKGGGLALWTKVENK